MRLSVLWVVLIVLLGPATAQAFDRLVVVGDSLSDPGNAERLLGRPFPDRPPYAPGRFSNGPLYADRLPGLLRLRANRVINLAVAGARTDAGNGAVAGLPGMRGQVDDFIATGPALDADDLVILYGGTNDLVQAADQALARPAAERQAVIDAAVAHAIRHLTHALLRLRGAGGRSFMLPNQFNLGATPSFRAGGATKMALGRILTSAFNRALALKVRDLAPRFANRLVLFNVQAQFGQMQRQPGRFGLAETSAACLETPSCRTARAADQNRFLYFDDLHPTAKVHLILARAMTVELRRLERR